MKTILIIFFFALPCWADLIKNPSEVRLYLGIHHFKLDQVNAEIESKGLEPLNDMGMAGLEFTTPLFWNVSGGFRYQAKYRKSLEVAETSAVPTNPYYASLQQTELMLVSRIDLLRTKILKMDLVGGAGMAKTQLQIRTASGEGEYEDSLESGNLVTMAGASVGVGWSKVYLFVEAGQEWNKLNGFERSRVTSNAIHQLDMTGPYALLGLVYSGLPSFIKPK